MLTAKEREGIEELIELKESRLNLGAAYHSAGLEVNVDSMVLLAQQVILLAARLLLDDQQRLTAGLEVSPHDDPNSRADVWVQVLVKKMKDGDSKGWADAAENYRMQVVSQLCGEGTAC